MFSVSAILNGKKSVLKEFNYDIFMLFMLVDWDLYCISIQRQSELKGKHNAQVVHCISISPTNTENSPRAT
jgi:hypothetical protein